MAERSISDSKEYCSASDCPHVTCISGAESQKLNILFEHLVLAQPRSPAVKGVINVGPAVGQSPPLVFINEEHIADAASLDDPDLAPGHATVVSSEHSAAGLSLRRGSGRVSVVFVGEVKPANRVLLDAFALEVSRAVTQFNLAPHRRPGATAVRSSIDDSV